MNTSPDTAPEKTETLEQLAYLAGMYLQVSLFSSSVPGRMGQSVLPFTPNPRGHCKWAELGDNLATDAANHC